MRGPRNQLAVLEQTIVSCTLCPRLVEYREKVAREKRRAFRGEEYWGRPVPAFGDPRARIVVIGLAPAAHGGNRTGRIFTGDSSGDFLYRTLYSVGLASQPHSRRRDDGLRLKNVFITAAARCAPPDNKPTPQELRNCRPYMARELQLLPRVRVVVVLGRIAFDAYLRILRDQGAMLRTDLIFGHNRIYRPVEGRPVLITSFHPSQQNTSTGKLTFEMFQAVFRNAVELSAD